jgi:hypothetical protein
MLCFAASAVAWLIQAGIVRSYVHAAVMGNWTDFSNFFGVEPPAKPGTYCFDYCVAELPFMAGWLAIFHFLLGFTRLFRSWLKPAQ